MRKIGIALVAASALLLSACEPNGQPNPVKATQAQKAAEAANSIQFSENAEIDNIKRRLELTSNPGQIGFVLLLNEMGKPVMYTSVKGKITSGSKRLTPPQEVKCLEVAGQVGCSQHIACDFLAQRQKLCLMRLVRRSQRSLVNSSVKNQTTRYRRRK